MFDYFFMNRVEVFRDEYTVSVCVYTYDLAIH